MKQLISILILTVCCLFPSKVWADDEPITIDLTQEESDEDPDPGERPSKGMILYDLNLIIVKNEI